MHRYFVEVAYKGTHYSGFQIQKNGNTIQSEVQKALAVIFHQTFELTGSSRTDAGVHALENFFHFDTELPISSAILYNINAILPPDIVLKNIHEVNPETHCRFHATSRQYKYYIYNKKNPFLKDTAYYYPYKFNLETVKAAAGIIKEYEDFPAFSKKNTQVKNFRCRILDSCWYAENDCFIYKVEANRFLRGMVRGFVASMLLAGREKISIQHFRSIIENKNNKLADFSAPAHGLFLAEVNYNKGIFLKEM